MKVLSLNNDRTVQKNIKNELKKLDIKIFRIVWLLNTNIKTIINKSA